MKQCVAYIRKDGLSVIEQRRLILVPHAWQGEYSPVQIVKEFVEKEEYNKGRCDKLFFNALEWSYKNGITELRRIENRCGVWEVSFYDPFGMLMAVGYSI